MIFIFTDPGLRGAISAVDENEQILFSESLERGISLYFWMNIVNIGGEPHYDMWTTRSNFKGQYEFLDCHFAIEIADYKNVEVGKGKGFAMNKKTGKPYAKKRISGDGIYKSGIHTGKIIQWFAERGVHDMIEVKPKEWQTIYKGFGGKDSKEKALNCLKEK
jgi:hypothetical protein